MRHISLVLSCLLLISCRSLSRVAENIEQSHYALYQQEALFVVSVEDKKVWLVNPTYTRCYYLKGRSYTEEWAAGDTMLIDEHLDEFHRLKLGKDCSLWQ